VSSASAGATETPDQVQAFPVTADAIPALPARELSAVVALDGPAMPSMADLPAAGDEGEATDAAVPAWTVSLPTTAGQADDALADVLALARLAAPLCEWPA